MTDIDTTSTQLDEAITKANEMVLGASLAIMDIQSTEPERRQGRFFQSLFAAIGEVLSAERYGRGDKSAAAVRLAEAVLGNGERR